jgi:hypothetical protein
MIGAFPQLHEDVLQSHLLHLPRAIYNVNVLHQDLCVHFTLHLGEANIDVHLFLGQQRFLHIGLEASEKEGLQNSMQTLERKGKITVKLRAKFDGASSFFFSNAFILWNNEAVVHLCDLRHAQTFHILRGPGHQDAGTPLLSLLQIVTFL